MGGKIWNHSSLGAGDL